MARGAAGAPRSAYCRRRRGRVRIAGRRPGPATQGRHARRMSAPNPRHRQPPRPGHADRRHRQLAADLKSGILLTSDHDGHGTYYAGNWCVDGWSTASYAAEVAGERQGLLSRTATSRPRRPRRRLATRHGEAVGHGAQYGCPSNHCIDTVVDRCLTELTAPEDGGAARRADAVREVAFGRFFSRWGLCVYSTTVLGRARHP